MGFLDRFKRNQEQPEQPIQQQQKNNKQEMIDIETKRLPDGRIQVEYFDNENPWNVHVTKLILDANTKTIEGQKVYQGLVSWYGENSRVIEDKTTGRLVREGEEAYKKVLFQMDKDRFLIDSEYCYDVMNGLLNQSRVNRYLYDGLKDNPRLPCGNYIGGVYPGNAKRHFFDPTIGEAVHNSEYMKSIRARIKEETLRIHAQTDRIQPTGSQPTSRMQGPEGFDR